MINETALICGRFLSPLCKAVKMHVILFFTKTRTREGEGRRGEGKGRKGREGGVCVCVCARARMCASAMFVNAIQQC